MWFLASFFLCAGLSLQSAAGWWASLGWAVLIIGLDMFIVAVIRREADSDDAKRRADLAEAENAALRDGVARVNALLSDMERRA
jgi:hypothetical protein